MGEVQNPSHVCGSVATTFAMATVVGTDIDNRVDVDGVATLVWPVFQMTEKYRRVDVVETAFGNGDNAIAVLHFSSKLR